MKASLRVSAPILSAAAVVAAMTLLAKLVALAKEMTVATLFGTGDDLDAFLVALLVPSFAITVVAGSFHAAFLPAYVRARHERGPEAAQRLLSGVLTACLALLSVMTLALVLGARSYLPLLASGFGEEKLETTRRLLCLLAPAVLLRGVSTLLAAVLNALERFALAAVAPAIIPASILLVLLFRNGIDALVFGTILGMALEAFLLAASLRRRGISLRPRLPVWDADLRRVAGQYLPMVSAALLLSSTTIVDGAMAAMLGAGSVAALHYAVKLVAFPLGLGTTALGTAVIPYFSRMAAEGDWDGVRATLRRYLVLVFAVTVPVALALFAASQWAASWIYERGSFSAEDTALVGEILALLALQIPFYVASVLVVRLLSAVFANHILLIGNVIGVTLNVVLNLLFMKKLGVAGIALSTACVYLVSFLFVLGAWHRISRRVG